MCGRVRPKDGAWIRGGARAGRSITVDVRGSAKVRRIEPTDTLVRGLDQRGVVPTEWMRRATIFLLPEHIQIACPVEADHSLAFPIAIGRRPSASPGVARIAGSRVRRRPHWIPTSHGCVRGHAIRGVDRTTSPVHLYGGDLQPLDASAIAVRTKCGIWVVVDIAVVRRPVKVAGNRSPVHCMRSRRHPRLENRGVPILDLSAAAYERAVLVGDLLDVIGGSARGFRFWGPRPGVRAGIEEPGHRCPVGQINCPLDIVVRRPKLEERDPAGRAAGPAEVAGDIDRMPIVCV